MCDTHLFLEHAHSYGFSDTVFEKMLIIEVINECAVELDFTSNEQGEQWSYIVKVRDEYFKIIIQTRRPLTIGEGIDTDNIEYFQVRPVRPYRMVGWLDEDDFYSKQQYTTNQLRYHEVFDDDVH